MKQKKEKNNRRPVQVFLSEDLYKKASIYLIETDQTWQDLMVKLLEKEVQNDSPIRVSK